MKDVPMEQGALRRWKILEVGNALIPPPSVAFKDVKKCGIPNGDNAYLRNSDGKTTELMFITIRSSEDDDVQVIVKEVIEKCVFEAMKEYQRPGALAIEFARTQIIPGAPKQGLYG